MVQVHSSHCVWIAAHREMSIVKEMLKTPALLQEVFWWEHCGGLVYSCEGEELLPITWTNWVIKTETGGWLYGRLPICWNGVCVSWCVLAGCSCDICDMNWIFKSPFGRAGESEIRIIENARECKRRDPRVAVLPTWKAAARVQSIQRVHRVQDQVRGLSVQLDTSCRNKDRLNDSDSFWHTVEVA